MSGYSIFYPMGTLVALTILVVTSGAFTRVNAIRRGEIAEDFYRLFQGGVRPELEAKITRHYANLLELPVLFYVAGLGIFATGLVDATFVGLFWVYVAVRVLHAIVHLSYNRPAHRAAVFGVGCIVLIAIWVRFLLVLGSNAGAA